MDPEGAKVTAETTATGQSASATRPVLAATGLVKSYGHVDALRGTDFELYPGEVLAVIGDNGAGKSTLIRCLSGAETPDAGTITLDGVPVHFRDVQQAKRAGIETVYQTLAVSPALDIATNLYLGREIRKKGPLGSVFRMLDTAAMRRMAREHVTKLGIETLQDITQAVETLSGGQRQAVAVARAAAFGSKVIIMDEPTAALGVRESGQVAALIRRLKEEGLPIVLISHDMPSVFALADRIHVQRLGRRAGIIKPGTHTMEQAVAIMTGAATALSTDPAISSWCRVLAAKYSVQSRLVLRVHMVVVLMFRPVMPTKTGQAARRRARQRLLRAACVVTPWQLSPVQR
jgi:fructose transport system ATP-binding protein